MGVNVSSRHTALPLCLEPPGPPGGLSARPDRALHLGMGPIAPAALVQALPAAGAVPRQRDRSPKLPAGASPGGQSLCCGSSSTVSFIPFRDTAFPETPKTFALMPGLAGSRRGRCSDAFCAGKTPGGRCPGLCPKPPAAAPVESDRPGANPRHRERRSRGRAALPGGHTVTSLRGQEAQVPLEGGTRSGALVHGASHAAAAVPGLPHDPRSFPRRRSGSI